VAKKITATALLVSLAVPAQAHSEDELADWVTDWHTAVNTRGGTLSPRLIAEYKSMHGRHRCSKVLGTPCPEKTSRRSEHLIPYNGMGSGVEQWRSLVEVYFGGNTDRALRVMACESGGNSNAANPSSSASGLFQFLASTWERVTGENYPGSVFNGESNIRAAAKLSNGGSDWSQWSCRP
jgi:hypothetical protein